MNNIYYVYDKTRNDSLVSKKWNYSKISQQDKKIVNVLLEIKEKLKTINENKVKMLQFLYLRIMFSKCFFFWNGIKTARKIKDISTNLGVKEIDCKTKIDKFKKFLIFHPYIFRIAVKTYQILNKN